MACVRCPAGHLNRGGPCLYELSNHAEQASVDVGDANRQLVPDAYQSDETDCLNGR